MASKAFVSELIKDISELIKEKQELESRIQSLEFALREILALKDCPYVEDEYCFGYESALERVHNIILDNTDLKES